MSSSSQSQQQPNTPVRGTPPKRLTLTPGPRPLHLGTGSFSVSSPSALTTPPTTAPLPPRRLGSVSYTAQDDFKLGFNGNREQEQQERSTLVRGGSLREMGGRRGRHGSSASVAATPKSGAFGSPRGAEGTLERAQKEALERKRMSASTLEEGQPPVLTLAEKHKDLLHFIAQKESKCVELRAQLAAHEADLLQLKKKWEKIVAKGNGARSGTSDSHSGLGLGRLDATGAVDLVRGIFGGLGELAAPSATSPAQPSSLSSSSVSTPNHVSSPLASSSNTTLPAKHETKTPVTTAASRAASKGHLVHTPQSSSSSNSTALSSANTTRLSLSSASSLGGAELLKDTTEPVVDDDLDAWGPFEGGPTDEPEALSALGLSGVEGEMKESATPVDKENAAQSPSWVPTSVGKRWEELRGTDTYAKSTKRASTLLSDVSTAWTSTLNALAPPPAPSLTRASGVGGSLAAPRPGPTIKLTSSPKPRTAPTKSSPAPITAAAPARPVSLMDDDDEVIDAAALGAVLQPSPSLSVKSKLSEGGSTKAGDDAFGDDWNW
ncbi:hypothetical protein BDV93DRAFT_524656 [Ceratobasidium sp. AG-I]|nr:hypothetical protein BDV93DRAFT_524656 [Ceratobasidium sp. AG-I]